MQESDKAYLKKKKKKNLGTYQNHSCYENLLVKKIFFMCPNFKMQKLVKYKVMLHRMFASYP